jgi:ligand-binding sensor protein
MRERATVIEECDAGMIKLVVPIFLGSEFIGAVGACGMKFEDGDIDSFLVNKMTDIAEDTVESLSATVPAIARGKAEELGRHIAESVEKIIAEFRQKSS